MDENKKRILITGMCGFVGHHICEAVLKNTDWDIIGLDKLTYASNGFDRIRDIKAYDDKRVILLTGDLTRPIPEGQIKEIGKVDYIFHLAAESHVDNSIKNPEPFVMSNVIGTMNMLDFAKKVKESLKVFIQFSTDEVYGPAPEGIDYKETDRLNSTNPYSASKAGAEQLSMAYANCYDLPVIISSTMNIIGERQHPEKFIPLVINKVLSGETVTIHSNKDKTQAGKRHYLHARNVAAALLFLIDNVDMTKSKYYIDNKDMPQFRFKYNIVGEKEMDNLELAKFIADIVGKKLNYELVNFHESRPGHDLRYSLDGSKLRELGYKHPVGFEESLKKTVEWFLDRKNKRWLK